jgi:hypothetical protein
MPLKLQHIGIYVKSFEDIIKLYELLGFYIIESIIDNHDKVELVLLNSPNCPVEIELIKPLDKTDKQSMDSHIFHHLSFETSEFDSDIDNLRKEGFILFKRPRPAPLFHNKRICWFFSKIGILELKEG